ncbi:PREDICTED: uncharacterized protein LOC108559866 [Nicrophorus vespilloides]|uniref:Uncharacterized protein LOC108559866 n=1 Tax=Nicrophorus vespilloides TaxID=110193 RepID=A0ABM1MDS4_NICVS|nr:PREDICTED: uncharacterized protein LOC108559866 [Nicrophorus vespilloides]
MVPRSLIGITACIIAMIVSQFIMTIFISDIAAVVRHYGHRLVVYSQQVTVLKIYLINAQISLRLQQKIMNYVDQLWSLSKGRQMPIYMRMGPSCLVEELKVHAFGKHIFNVITNPITTSLPPIQLSSSELSRICCLAVAMTTSYACL